MEPEPPPPYPAWPKLPARGEAAEGGSHSAVTDAALLARVGSSPRSSPPTIDSSETAGTHAQQRLAKLNASAAEALRHSFAAHARTARSQLEASAQSAARGASMAGEARAARATVAQDLVDLAESMRRMRDETGDNAALWPRAAEV